MPLLLLGSRKRVLLWDLDGVRWTGRALGPRLNASPPTSPISVPFFSMLCTDAGVERKAARGPLAGVGNNPVRFLDADLSLSGGVSTARPLRPMWPADNSDNTMVLRKGSSTAWLLYLYVGQGQGLGRKHLMAARTGLYLGRSVHSPEANGVPASALPYLFFPMTGCFHRFVAYPVADLGIFHYLPARKSCVLTV